MSLVEHDHAHRLWLLRTPAGSYVLRLDEPGDERLELPAEGGAFFGVAGLGVRYEDGTSALEWRYAGHSVENDTLVVVLADRHYPLEVSLHYRVRGEVVERWTTLRNTGEAPISLLRTDSASWTLPRRADARLS